jgi:hypothetical protein
MMQRIVRTALTVFSLSALSYPLIPAIAQGTSLTNQVNTIESQERLIAETPTTNTTNLEAQKAEIKAAVSELANKLSQSAINPNSINEILTTHLNKHPVIFGTAFAFSPRIRKASPFVFRGDKGLVSKDIATEIDYTTTAWYANPMRTGDAVWSKPYFDVGGAGESTLMTTYSVPIYDKSSRFIGVLTSDLLLKKFSSNQLEDQKRQIEAEVKALATKLNQREIDPNSIYGVLSNHLNSHPYIFGSAFAFAPDIRQASPFVFRGGQGIVKKDIAPELNYATEADWYTVPVAARKAVWSEPYFDVGGAGESVLMMTYSMPLYDTSQQLVGVLTSDFLLSSLK